MYTTHKIASIFAISTSLLIVFVIQTRVVQATTISPVQVELIGDPGTTLKSSIKVTNETQNSETLYTITLNFEPKGDESGEPNFIPTKDGLAAWVKTENSITLGPKEQRVVPFTIQIPANAEPGGYFGAIFTSTTAPRENGSGGVVLSERVGSLVLLRVNGPLVDSGGILEFDTKNKDFWYIALPVRLYYRFQNSGLDRVRPLGDILIKNWFGRTTQTLNANPEGGNVLPKSIRRFETVWQNHTDGSGAIAALPEHGFWSKVVYEARNFAFGKYTIQLNLAYGSNPLQSATASTSVFILPWHLTLVCVLSFLIVALFLKLFIRRYNRWIIHKASNKK